MEELLTVAQVAERLGMSQAGIKKWIAQGKLGASRLGARVWAIPVGEVERVEGARRVASPETLPS